MEENAMRKSILSIGLLVGLVVLAGFEAQAQNIVIQPAQTKSLVRAALTDSTTTTQKDSVELPSSYWDPRIWAKTNVWYNFGAATGASGDGFGLLDTLMVVIRAQVRDTLITIDSIKRVAIPGRGLLKGLTGPLFRDTLACTKVWVVVRVVDTSDAFTGTATWPVTIQAQGHYRK